MSTAQLVALERTEKANKVKKCGYIPGIIYGKELDKNLRVKFKNSDIANIISKHGERARLDIVLGGKKYMAFIKEVQKDFVSYGNIHVDLQVVSSKEEIRVKVPVVFEGTSTLEFKKLHLEIVEPNIELLGNAEKIPEHVILDVANMEAGKHITANDLKLDKDIKAHNANETIAVVCKLKETKEVEPEKTENDETSEVKE